MKKFKVYAFIGKTPQELVDEFATLGEARTCKKAVETHGIKVFGTVMPAKARVIVKNV